MLDLEIIQPSISAVAHKITSVGEEVINNINYSKVILENGKQCFYTRKKKMVAALSVGEHVMYDANSDRFTKIDPTALPANIKIKS